MQRKFTSQDAWDRYADNISGRKILLEKNMKLFYAEFDEFRRKLRGGIGIRSSLTS